MSAGAGGFCQHWFPIRSIGNRRPAFHRRGPSTTFMDVKGDSLARLPQNRGVPFWLAPRRVTRSALPTTLIDGIPVRAFVTGW